MEYCTDRKCQLDEEQRQIDAIKKEWKQEWDVINDTVLCVY